MTRDARAIALLAAAGSAALLAGAYAFQAAGYLPCRMCYWQRWPHFAAVAAGLLIWAMRRPAARGPLAALAAGGALAAAATSAIGVFHTGVERGWWEGPASCTGAGLGGLSGADLLATDGPGIVLCDEVAWSLFGVSMASWNAVLSAGLVVLWVLAARRALRTAG